MAKIEEITSAAGAKPFYTIGPWCMLSWVGFLPTSVTRSGDLFNFGQLFKAFGNN